MTMPSIHDLRTILVATDFSAAAAAALGQAGRLASAASATLLVTHVVDDDAVDDLARVLRTDPQDLATRLRREAADRLAEHVESVLPAAPVETFVQVGHPLDVIMDAVRSRSVDLLVMGAHGEGEPGPGAGTLAGQCVRLSTAHVLLVRADQTRPARTVMACVDLTPATDPVADLAASFAAVEGAKLVLLHAHGNPIDAFRWGALVSDAGEQYEAYIAGLRTQLDAVRRRLAEAPEAPAIETSLVYAPDAGRAIVAMAKKLEIDVAVLGTKSRSRLSEVILGSTPARVLRETATSVLAVKPKRLRD